MSLLHEWKRVLASSGYRWGLAVLALLGAAALFYGYTEKERHRRLLDQVPSLVEISDRLYFDSRFGDDEEMGRIAYYLRQSTEHRLAPLAQLSLGVSDLHPSALAIHCRGLYAQLFNSDLSNPQKAAVGNFDLAFVLVALFPLLLIACCYDLLSKEEESGTLRLVRSLGANLTRFLCSKLVLRLGPILVLADLLCCLGFWWAGENRPELMLAWLLAVDLYLVFWAGVVLLICSWRRASGLNAVLLVAIWLLLVVVGPAGANLLLSAGSTPGGGEALSLQQRQLSHQGWDRPKEETREMAAAGHRRWRTAPIVGEEFSWGWYFAMHEAADQAVASQVQDYFEQLRRRELRTSRLGLLLPSVALQNIFDRLAATDLETQLRYLQFVARQHEQMEDRFMADIIDGRKFSQAELSGLVDSMPARRFQAQGNVPWSGLAGLGLMTLLVGLGAWLRLERLEWQE